MVWCRLLNISPKWSQELSCQRHPFIAVLKEGDAFQIQYPVSSLNASFSWDRFPVSIHKSIYFWFRKVWNGIHWVTAVWWLPPVIWKLFKSDVWVMWCLGMPTFSFKIKVVFLCSCEFQGDFYFFFFKIFECFYWFAYHERKSWKL